MNDNCFITTYNMLSFEHQQVIFKILIKMKHRYFTHKVSKKILDIRGNIKLAQEKAGLTDQEVCDSAFFITDKELTLDEYRNIRNKNVQNPKKWLSTIAFVLDTTEEEIKRGKSKEYYQNLVNMSNDFSNINWLYNSLNHTDKDIIMTLARELQLLELL